MIRWIAIRGVLVAGLLTVGCGVPLEEQPTAISPELVPEGLRPSDSTVPETRVADEWIDIWLVRDDQLVATRHAVEPPVDARVALAELLVGPTEDEQGKSLRSALPDASVVGDVEVSGGVAVVELAPSFSDIPAKDQVLAVGQIVLTMTDLRGVGRVRFVVDDAQIAVPLPGGDASEDSVSRDDYIALADTPS